MNPQFSQPKGAVSKETNKDSIARKFGCKKSDVLYAKTGSTLTGYKVIYDKVSQRSYALPSNLPAGATITSLTNGILVHSGGTVDLGALAVLRGEFVTLVEDFTSGFTISVKNELVGDDTYLYRWAGTLPKTVSAGGTVAGTGAITDSTWVKVGPYNLLSTDKGSDLILYRLTPTSLARSISQCLKERVSLSDFGFPAIDAGDSINQALSFLTSQGDAFARGGTVNVPRGVHKVNTTILLDRTAGGSDVTDNYTLVGEGAGTSELRADTGLSSVSAIVKTNEPGSNFIQLYRLAHFSTRGGYNGVRVETASRGSMERIKVENSTNDGIYIGNSWVNHIEGVLVNNAGANGVHFDAGVNKQKTSTHMNGGYVNTTVADGIVFGFMNYSAATAVACDNAGLNAYHIKNSESFIMNGCGNEAAQRAGIYAEASSAIGPNNSITINNHFSHNSNLSNTGWANLLHVKSSDGVLNKVRINNSTSHMPTGNEADIVADGVGAIVVVDDCTLPKGVKTYNGGYIDWVHHPLLVNSKSVVAATATAICKLGSTQGHTTNLSADTSCFAGEITVVASTSAPSSAVRRIAVYKLLVCVTAEQGKEVTVMNQLGYLSGNVAGSPSFTWSINSSNQLVATPIGSSAGTFWFEITTTGQVKAAL